MKVGKTVRIGKQHRYPGCINNDSSQFTVLSNQFSVVLVEQKEQTET